MTSEQNQIIKLVLITGFIAVIVQAPFFSTLDEPDVYVNNYTATLYPDFVLEETYTYQINVPDKHYLYRYWETKLTNTSIETSHIQLLDVFAPPDTIRYMKDHQSETTFFDDVTYDDYWNISYYAYNNEVGAYNRDGYQLGEYTIQYRFKIVPPLEYDDNFVHLNLKLANTHIPYKNVKVRIIDNENLLHVFSHPPNLRTDTRNRVFTGEITENELLEFEILFHPSILSTVDGVLRYVEDVDTKTFNANNALTREYQAAYLALWVTKLSGFLMPLVFIYLWNRYGREKQSVVPRYLSTVPVKHRKPWIVNLIFAKGSTDFDENGFNATLIDLHLNNKIKIIENGEEIEIKLLDDRELDSYESDVYMFLESLAVENTVFSSHLSELTEKADSDIKIRAKVLQIKNKHYQLTEGTHNKVAQGFTVSGRKRLIIPGIYSVLLFPLSLTGLLLSSFTENIFFHAMGYSVIPMVQVIIASLFPRTLFGYWKKEYSKEKLEWDAFKRHLTEYSRLEQYGTQDINMWGKWLVYGTSLGVGEQVANTLKTLNIPLEVPVAFPKYRHLFNPITVYTYYTPSSGSSSSYSSRSSSGSGGGFGGGRGFGGGGSGVR